MCGLPLEDDRQGAAKMMAKYGISKLVRRQKCSGIEQMELQKGKQRRFKSSGLVQGSANQVSNWWTESVVGQVRFQAGVSIR